MQWTRVVSLSAEKTLKVWRTIHAMHFAGSLLSPVSSVRALVPTEEEPLHEPA